jgi:hypothetical protein
MLHVGYSRLDKNQLDVLQMALNEQIDLISDDLHQKFEQFEGNNYFNEAHSYIGTEQPILTSELEVHYKKYFDARYKTLEALKSSPEN